MKKSSAIKLVLLCSLLVCLACQQETQNQSPDFIVILTDDQNWVGTSFLTLPDDLPKDRSELYDL